MPGKSLPTIKTIWGLAKSPELNLNDEELHLIVSGHTGKESIRKLNTKEIAKVVGVLQSMKDSVKKSNRKNNPSTTGNQGTVNQRKKIDALTKELGWEDEARLRGFCKKMFKVERVEWLNYKQCSKLIEALKSMGNRIKVKLDTEETKEV